MLKYRYLNIKLKFLDFLIAILFLSLSFFFLISWLILPDANLKVIIKSSSSMYEYPIDIDRIVKIKGNLGDFIINIKNKTVSVIKSNCSKKICLHIDVIKKAGSSIICIPNKVSVTIESKNNVKEVDTICK